MHKYIKIIILTLFVLALIFGFVQKYPTFFGSREIIQKFTAPDDQSLQNYYLRGQQLADNTQPASMTVTFLAVGDIMLSRDVGLAIKNSNDVNYPFQHLAEIFNPASGSGSFNFANLESPVAPTNPILGGTSMVFGANADYLAGLKNANFQIVNLANNHAFDQGLGGVTSTIASLNNLDIAHEGTGENLGEAWEPAIVSADGIKICFVGASYSSINDSGKTRNNYVARIDQLDWLKTAITTAKQECDFTVATMHAGVEYTRTPNAAQTTFAHAAIDDGADIVIGAHPHWVQTIEKYCAGSDSLPQSAADGGRAGEGAQSNCANPKYIFYSLGNFVFDQDFSQDTMEGLTLKITISETTCHTERSDLSTIALAAAEGSLSNSQQSDSSTALGMVNNESCADVLQGQKTYAQLDQIELVPVTIQNSQPRLASADEAKKILQGIGESEDILK